MIKAKELLAFEVIFNICKSCILCTIDFVITVFLYTAFQTSNPAWPTSLCFNPPLQERLKDLSVKNWNQLAGSGPVPWRQAPSLFNSSIPASEQSRFPYDYDISGGINKLNANDRLSASPLEKKKIEDLSERLMNGNLKLGAREMLDNGNAGMYYALYWIMIKKKKEELEKGKKKKRGFADDLLYY